MQLNSDKTKTQVQLGTATVARINKSAHSMTTALTLRAVAGNGASGQALPATQFDLNSHHEKT